MAAIQSIPAIAQLTAPAAQPWAPVLLFVVLIQSAYAVWMMTLPDWRTVWIVMIELAAVSALYGLTLGIVIVTPPNEAAWLGIERVGQVGRWWCAAMLATTCAATFACGRIAQAWRKQADAD
jgi:hypothetical protein